MIRETCKCGAEIVARFASLTANNDAVDHFRRAHAECRATREGVTRYRCREDGELVRSRCEGCDCPARDYPAPKRLPPTPFEARQDAIKRAAALVRSTACPFIRRAPLNENAGRSAVDARPADQRGTL